MTWFGTDNIRAYAGVAAGVPGPSSWAMLIGGSGLVGASLRRRGPSVHLT